MDHHPDHNEAVTAIVPPTTTDDEGNRLRTHNQTSTVRTWHVPVKPHDSEQSARLLPITLNKTI